MHRWWLVVVMLASCECGKKPKAPVGASGSAIPIDAAAPRVDLASRFTELREQRALRCMLVSASKPGSMSSVLDHLSEHADPILVRAAAFSLVDEAKPDGETPEMNALTEAIHVLGPLGDLEGLRMAFARLDQFPDLHPRYLGYDEAYRARIDRAVPKDRRSPLSWVTQIAMAGNVAAGAKIYDEELAADDKRPTTEHVAALVALGRIAKLRELLAVATERDRPMLVDKWLETAAQMKQPLGDAVSEMLALIEKSPDTVYPGGDALLAASRSPDKAAVARLRAALIARWSHEYAVKYPGAVESMYANVLSYGSADERAKIEVFVPPDVKEREKVLRTGSLDAALAYALAAKHPSLYVPRVWTRAVVEGADAAFFKQIEAKLCKGGPPDVVTPTPPAKGMQIVVTEKLRKQQHECSRIDLIVRLTNGEAIVDEEIYEGDCQGACTAAEKREGEKTIKEIERRIARGESTESELDYDFTGCMFVGHVAGRIDRVGERQVAIFAEKSIGPHSTEQTTHMLAFEVCGELFVSQGFGLRYSGGWQLGELTVDESPDKREIRVRAANDSWRGFIYRATLPECPGSPDERVQEADY